MTNTKNVIEREQKTVRNNVLSSNADEIIQQSLIDYALDKRLFEHLPALIQKKQVDLNKVRKFEIIENEIENYSDAEKKYIFQLNALMCKKTLEDKTIEMLFHYVGNIHFLKAPIDIVDFQKISDLEDDFLSKKIRNGEDIYLLQESAGLYY